MCVIKQKKKKKISPNITKYYFKISIDNLEYNFKTAAFQEIFICTSLYEYYLSNLILFVQ